MYLQVKPQQWKNLAKLPQQEPAQRPQQEPAQRPQQEPAKRPQQELRLHQLAMETLRRQPLKKKLSSVAPHTVLRSPASLSCRGRLSTPFNEKRMLNLHQSKI